MAAIVNICVDPRLDQELIRLQIRAHLDRLRLSTDLIFVTSDVAGNIGTGFRNTAVLLHEHQQKQIVLAAVLYHNDCAGEMAGQRKPLGVSRQEAETFLARLEVRCPVLTGTIRTEDSYLTLAGSAAPSAEVLSFRMPRMYG